jgi:hypothetical protein
VSDLRQPYRSEVFIAEDGEPSIRVVMVTQDEYDELVAELEALRGLHDDKDERMESLETQLLAAEAELTTLRVVRDAAQRHMKAYGLPKPWWSRDMKRLADALAALPQKEEP